MSDRDDDLTLSASERATRDAVRSLLPARADVAFRARLRHEFVSGRIGRRAGLPSPAPWFLRAYVLAPATAAVILVALFVANEGPEWQVVKAQGEGHVQLDGASIATADVAGITARLKHGAHLQLEGDVTLDLVAQGNVAVTAGAGSDLQLPASPNRWWWRNMIVSVASGDTYFTTGRTFRGAQLDVHTPDAVIRAVGTSFAVLTLPNATCVCVMEGHVNVIARDGVPGSGVEVPHGMRRVVDHAGAAQSMPILDDSVHELHRQRSLVGKALGR